MSLFGTHLTRALKALRPTRHLRNEGTRALEGRLCTGGTWGTLFSKLPKALSSHHASLLSKCVGPIRKNLPPFTFAPRIQTRRMREGNRFCCPTPWSVFDLPGDRQFVLGKVWKAELVLQLKERITPPSHTRNSRQGVFCKKQRVPPKISQNSQENTCASVSFLIHFQNIFKNETLAQVFSCELCEIFKNTFSNRTPLLAASDRGIASLSSLRSNPQRRFLYWKRFLLNSWRIYGNYPLRGVISKTLQALMDAFLRIHKEFRNYFLKEHLQQTTLQLFSR